MIRLHLGCGNKKLKGYINCDISKEVNPDMIFDLNKTFPSASNTIDEILTEHTMEHVLHSPNKRVMECNFTRNN